MIATNQTNKGGNTYGYDEFKHTLESDHAYYRPAADFGCGGIGIFI